MMGERSAQGSLLGADVQHLELVGRDSFYGFVSQHGRELFSDDDFASLYCPDNGRPSVAPSLLAVALLLQTHDRVSDQEAKDRADFDLRWKVALDATIIFGRGAVEDTYNLIGHGIAKLCRVLAEVAEQELVEWVKAHGFERYFGSSLKGSAEVDWDDAESQEAFLTELIADGERVLWAVLPSA